MCLGGLLCLQSLNNLTMSLIFRAFARNLGKIKAVPKAQVKTQREPSKGKEKGTGLGKGIGKEGGKKKKIKEEDVDRTSVKKKNEEIDERWMASRHTFIGNMPKAWLIGAKSIFSGHSSTSIRDWGYKIAQSYVEMNGLERPQDITKFQPFTTTLGLLNKASESSHSRGFYKLPSENSEKIFELEKIKDLQAKENEFKLKYQYEHAVGYLYKRMPNTYASAYRILHEIKHRLPDLDPKTCLDYGAGTGACSWAATELFPDLSSFAIEPSKEMRTLGKKVSAKMPKISWGDSMASLPSIAETEGIYDIVICGYVLSEVENPVTRNLIVDALWQRTRKVMIFIEPGTPKGSRLIYSIREWVLKTMTRAESNIVAPCPHEGECPLASHKNSWCHFSQFTCKYPKDVITRVKGEKNFENEKFSYIVVKRGIVPRYYSKDQELNLAEKSFLWPRLVRPTIRRQGHIVYDVCRKDKLERLVLSKSAVEKDVYRFLRKAHWGDLWPFEDEASKKVRKVKDDKKDKK